LVVVIGMGVLLRTRGIREEQVNSWVNTVDRPLHWMNYNKHTTINPLRRIQTVFSCLSWKRNYSPLTALGVIFGRLQLACHVLVQASLRLSLAWKGLFLWMRSMLMGMRLSMISVGHCRMHAWPFNKSTIPSKLVTLVACVILVWRCNAFKGQAFSC
jgi:hypothetical protein